MTVGLLLTCNVVVYDTVDMSITLHFNHFKFKVMIIVNTQILLTKINVCI